MKSMNYSMNRWKYYINKGGSSRMQQQQQLAPHMHMQLFVASNLLWHNHIKYSPPTRFVLMHKHAACGRVGGGGGGGGTGGAGNILKACSSFCLAVLYLASPLDTTPAHTLCLSLSAWLRYIILKSWARPKRPSWEEEQGGNARMRVNVHTHTHPTF